ncbi:MAG TPA: hypothetical protein VNZ04_14105, partial [Trinickia sp.]|nr:hypothetical protein [Trinickia sp.]
ERQRGEQPKDHEIHSLEGVLHVGQRSCATTLCPIPSRRKVFKKAVFKKRSSKSGLQKADLHKADLHKADLHKAF